MQTFHQLFFIYFNVTLVNIVLFLYLDAGGECEGDVDWMQYD